jgi:rhamnosyltransferase
MNIINTNLPKCCVLLAAYNGISFLRNQVDTILNQTDVQVELYISIDKSSDGTEEFLGKIQINNDNVKIISCGQRFGSAAKNFYHLIGGVDIAEFDYVAFSDQDDIWDLDKLSSAIDQMQIASAVGFSSDVMSYWPISGKKKLLKKSYKQTTCDHYFESPGPGCSQVFTANTFVLFQEFVRKNMKLISTFNYHDWLIYAFYRENSLNWLISDQPKMLYVQHEANQIGANIGFSGFFKRAHMINSKWYRSHVFLLRDIFNNKEMKTSLTWFMVNHCFSLRRRKTHSLGIFFLFLCRVF